ncbi:MAG: phosphotransferase [Planctomycetota bacterium]|nr:phosphotransferase [Planctomycetota bacterium]
MSEKINVPRSAAELSPDWFSQCLSQHFKKPVIVNAIEELPLLGGIPVTSVVQRWSLKSAEEAPSSVIVKLNKPAWATKHGHGLYERELKFYSELCGSHAAPIPTCYFAASDGENQHFVFVLEDLSAANPGHCLEGLTVQQSKAAMVDLANFERMWWKSESLESWPTKTVTGEGLKNFVEHFERQWPKLIEMGKYRLSEALIDAVSNYDKARFLEDRLNSSQEPLTLVHGDLHGENFIIDDSRLIIFDWQNAAYGHPSIDAAQLLAAMKADFLAANWQAVLSLYCQSLEHVSLKEMEDAVRAQARSVFMGVACWLVSFEADSMRDASTIQNYWSRLSEFMICLSR